MSPITLPTGGGSYSLSCDFGVGAPCFVGPLGPGTCSYIGASGTRFNFTCATGPVPDGSYPVNCVLGGSCSSCPQNRLANTLTVGSPPPPPPPSSPPPGACTNPILVSGSATPSVLQGSNITITCDYGAAYAAGCAASIVGVSNAGGSCSPPTVAGSVATINCNAPTPGLAFTNACVPNICGSYCGALNPVNTTDVIAAPACSAYGPTVRICGTVLAAEDNATPLSGIPIELRDAKGVVLKTKKTVAGVFTFSTADVTGTSYVVAAIPGRNQSATPVHKSLPSLGAVGALVPFKLRGVPAVITIPAPPSSLVVMKAGSAYMGSTPPGSDSPNVYTKTADASGNVVMEVPGGTVYHLRCWIPQVLNGNVTYQRTADQTITGAGSGGIINPDAAITLTSACGP